jgi:hypothetical protein
LARLAQHLFVPKKFSGLRLSNLPLSAALVAVLQRLKLATFGDLNGMAIDDFQRLRRIGTALLNELTDLTQRVRDGEFGGGGGNASVLNSSGLQTLPATAPPDIVAQRGRPRKPDDERIFIPKEARRRAIFSFQFSARLRHALGYVRFCFLGDIHGMSYAEFRKRRNCGETTVTELRELVRLIQAAHHMAHADAAPPQWPGLFAANAGDWLTVPARVQDLNFCDLPLSVRLGNILAKRKVTRLGDLNGVPISELKAARNCGNVTIAELVNLIEKAAAGGFKAITNANVRWSPVDLASFLDGLMLELSARQAWILERRFAGEKERLPTLKQMGAKFNLTRERVRQIIDIAVARLRRAGSQRLKAYLRQVEEVCLETVCPLTPAQFKRWMGGEKGALRFSPGFYARLLCELNPAIPAWRGRQQPFAIKGTRAGLVEAELISILKQRILPVALPEAFSLTKIKVRDLDVREFLEMLRHGPKLRVEFHRPDRPTVILAKLHVADVARAVLGASDCPLTPEEILSQARALFGDKKSKANPQYVEGALSKTGGFYLLGPRTFGLEKHLTLPKALQARVKTDFAELLARKKCPVSTTDVIHNQRFDWVRRTNANELAGLLRADARFIDLGKFLFALTAWGIRKREHVKDLIPRVLARAGRPLTEIEILARLQKFRSLTRGALWANLREHPQVRDYGSGYYGLKSRR